MFMLKYFYFNTLKVHKQIIIKTDKKIIDQDKKKIYIFFVNVFGQRINSIGVENIVNKLGVEVSILIFDGLIEFVGEALSFGVDVLAPVLELSERFQSRICDYGLGLQQTNAIGNGRYVHKAEHIIGEKRVFKFGIDVVVVVVCVVRRDGRSVKCQVERRIVALMMMQIGLGRCAQVSQVDRKQLGRVVAQVKHFYRLAQVEADKFARTIYHKHLTLRCFDQQFLITVFLKVK